MRIRNPFTQPSPQPDILAAGLLTVALAASGCGHKNVVLRTPSPDGQQAAEVRSHWALDPPSQSLWIQNEGEAPRKLAKLGEDSEWCEQILWRPDSSKVAFLINGVRLDVYDAKGANLIKQVSLVPPDRDPGSRQARDVRFSPAGDVVEFRDCSRSQPDCKPLQRIVL
jgi:hypothetical protein